MAEPKYFKLIQTLTKAEIKNFRSFLGKMKNDGVLLALFNASIDLKNYDKKVIESKLPANTKKYFNVYSNRLYDYLIESLSKNSGDLNPIIEVNERVNKIDTLLNKWLIPMAAKEIEALEKFIEDQHQNFYIAVLHHLKCRLYSQSRQIKVSDSDQPHNLEQVDADLNKSRTSILSEYLSVNIYDYINRYSILEIEEHQADLSFFIAPALQKEIETSQDAMTKINYYRSVGIYYLIRSKFDISIQNFINASVVFESIAIPDLSLKKKYLFTLGSIIQGYLEFIRLNDLGAKIKPVFQYLKKQMHYLELYINDFTLQDQVKIKQNCYTNQIFAYTFLGDEQGGLEIIRLMIELMEDEKTNLPSSKLIINYASIAYFYFIIGEYQKANDWNNKVLKFLEFKKDKILAKLAFPLELLIQFEFGNYDLLISLNRSYARYLQLEYPKFKENKEIFSFFNKAVNLVYDKKQFKSFIEESLKLNDEDIKSYFYYINFQDWLKSKLRNTTTAVIIKEKIKQSIDV